MDMQYLEARIPVPENCEIITKVEYEELKKSSTVGDTMNLNEFSKRIGRSNKWVVDNVLQNPKFKKRIDVKNGGFAYYRTAGNDTYVFLRSKATEFIENNFSDIYK